MHTNTRKPWQRHNSALLRSPVPNYFSMFNMFSRHLFAYFISAWRHSIIIISCVFNCVFVEKFCYVKMAGRPQAPRQISNVVIPAAMFPGVDLSPCEIYGKMNDELQWLQWLAKHRLVRNSAVCGRCAMPMALVARAEVSDGYSWRRRQCNCHSSVRAGSFFQQLWYDNWADSYDYVLLVTRSEAEARFAFRGYQLANRSKLQQLLPLRISQLASIIMILTIRTTAYTNN